MKKLIAMLGAVAMSFGLFADAYTNSFEVVEEITETFDAKTAEGWTWAGDPIPVALYATKGETRYAYIPDARRCETPDNLQYLQLSTSGAELTREVGEGNAFLDQLVKFTGFEDDPNFTEDMTSKIAVWLKAVDADEGTEGETNLYVTVGNELNQKVSYVIASDIDVESWHRLTIKSLGNIMGNGTRAGFLIYIDGAQVAIAEKPLLFTPDTLIDNDVRAYQSKGQLFPAMVAGNAAFNSVSYKGIGGIDDIIIDNDGPEFAQITMRTFTVTPGDGLTVQSVVSEDGETLTEPYTVQDGKKVTVTWALADGYKRMSGSLTQEETIDAAEIDIEPDDDIEVAEIFATKVNGQATTDYAESELLGMMNSLVNGDTVTFVNPADIWDANEEDELYVIDEDTTIKVDVASDDSVSWTVTVPGKAGSFTDNTGAEAFLTKEFVFTENENGTLVLGGDVVGMIQADKVKVTAAINVSGVLMADELSIDETIQLVGNGSVITVDGFTDSEIVPVDGKELGKTALGETGLYTYTSVDPEPTIEYVNFTVTYNADQVENVTVTTNNGVADIAVELIDSKYTVESNAVVTVAATAKDGYKNVTITGDNVTVDGGVFTASEAESVITIDAEAILLTATFVDEDGETELDKDDKVAYNTTPEYKGETPTKTGYTFAGWTPALGPITENATYMATYTANSYAINYTWFDNDGASVTALENTLPAQFTFDGESITLVKSMVTLTEAYTDVAFAPATVTTDKAEAFAVTVTLTKKAEDDTPGADILPEGSERNAYVEWAKNNGVTSGDTELANELVVAYKLGVDGVSSAEAAVAAAKKKVDALLKDVDLSALAAGGTSEAALATLNAELAKNGLHATLVEVPKTEVDTTASLYRLAITAIPVN